MRVTACADLSLPMTQSSLHIATVSDYYITSVLLDGPL